jgi:hypothetical protein
MLLKLTTWNGNNINDWNGSTGSFEAILQPGTNTMPTANPEYADMGGRNAILTGVSLSGASLTLTFVLHGTLHTAMDTLNKYFRADTGVSGTLVATDGADSDRSWYVTGRVAQPPTMMDTEKVSTMVVVLALDAPYWQETVLQTDTWTITASGQTRAITPRGNLPTNPVYELTPTGAKTGGYSYKRFVTIYNPLTRSYPIYPVSLVGASLDTAALVAGGKMQADGDDFRFFLDNRMQGRWLYNINNATSRMWGKLTLKPKVELTLGTSIANSAVVPAVIQFDATSEANKAAVKKLPAKGVLQIDSELFYYTSVNAPKCQVVPSLRQTRGTSFALHSAGATCRWIEHDIYLYYGNASVTAPYANDLAKPAIELDATSTNTVWKWDACFWDTAGLRTGKWTSAILSGADPAAIDGGCSVYTGDHGVLADPASNPGIRLLGYTDVNGIVKAGKGRAEIKFYHPGGMTSITCNLEKYRVGTLWPKARIQKSVNGLDWEYVADIAIPGSASSWTAQAVGATALGGTYNYVRIYVDGVTSASATAAAYIEINDFTATLDSANVPQVTLGAEQASNYSLDATLANSANSYAIDVECLMIANVTVTIDTENMTCTAPTGEGVPIDLDTNREDWLPLEGGVSNTLTFTDAGTSGLTLVTKYRARNSL